MKLKTVFTDFEQGLQCALTVIIGAGLMFSLTQRFQVKLHIDGLVAIPLYLLAIAGWGCFFTVMFLAVGLVRLPMWFEWPARDVRGVVRSTEGWYVVPLPVIGRVQIYDPEWHFVRGWNVQALGGPFRLRMSPEGLIEVFTFRGDRHDCYTSEGQLVQSEQVDDLAWHVLPKGESLRGPAPILLWIFTDPRTFLFVGAIGAIGIFSLDH